MSYLPNSDFYLNVAKGLVPKHSIMSKFGQIIGLTTAYQDVWDVGGNYTYPANATADITEIVSTAADTVDIEVQGLAADGTLTVQTMTLNGTTPVTLTTPLWRVFRLKNVGATDLAGDVTAENTGNTVEYAKIQIGNNQTLMSLYTIPLGYTGYLVQGTNSIVGTNRTYSISGRLTMRPYGSVFQLKKTFGLAGDGSGYMVMPHPLPGKIPAKTDIRVSVAASATQAAGGLNNTFEILLVQD